MNQYRRLAIGAVASLGLALAGAAAFAHSGGMGGGMGHMGEKHEKMASMHGGAGGHGAAQQLMTQAERDAMREKMQAAKTPQERQAIAAANRAEMEKRAKEKGITLPEQRGGHAAMGGMRGEGGRHGGGEHKH